MSEHLFLVNDFPPALGGQSAYLSFVAGAFPSGKVIVLAPAGRGAKDIDRKLPYKVVRRPYLIAVPWLEKPVKILGVLFWAAILICQQRPKLLHGADVLSSAVAAWVLHLIFRIDYAVYTHSSDILEYEKTPLVCHLQLQVLRSARFVMTNSTFTAGHLKRMGVAENRISVLCPRIDPSGFSAQGGIDDYLGRQGLAGCRIVLGISRLVLRKGNDTVIRAFLRVAAAEPAARYVIFGQGPDEARLRALTRELGLESCVVFVSGTNEEKIMLLNACAVFVMVSRALPEKGDYEGFGIVYLEAAACGKPCVAGDCGGVRDAVDDGVSGLLVPPDDPDAAADAIIRLLKDGELNERLGRQGRERLMARFDSRAPVREIAPMLSI